MVYAPNPNIAMDRAATANTVCRTVLTHGHFRGGLHCFRRSLVVAKDKQRLVRLCSCEQQIAAYYHRENQCQRKSYIDEKAPNDPEEEGKPPKPFGYPVEKSQIRIPNLKIARLPKVLLCRSGPPIPGPMFG